MAGAITESGMQSRTAMHFGTIKRPNTFRFDTKHLPEVEVQDVYEAVNKELGITDTCLCVSSLERGWYNVTFNNEARCARMALHGMLLKNALIQCEHTDNRNSAVVYLKAPYEMSDSMVTNVLIRTMTSTTT